MLLTYSYIYQYNIVLISVSIHIIIKPILSMEAEIMANKKSSKNIPENFTYTAFTPQDWEALRVGEELLMRKRKQEEEERSKSVFERLKRKKPRQ